MTEFGVVHVPMPNVATEVARRAEAMGFDICLFTDSQRLAGDPFAEACLAARGTSTIRLGTGVTNPVTRSPAVIASAIATLQVESAGRAILGIARGDSAAAHAGRRPASVAEMTAAVHDIRELLVRGLTWLEPTRLPPVPVDFACSGPRSIAAAAAVADRVSLAVGASPDRIRWALGIARTAAVAAGRPAGAVSLGAYLNVVVDDSRQRARDHARAGVGVVAHFTAMAASPAAVPPAHVATFAQLRSGYEMDRHTQIRSFQARVSGDDFIDWFAIAGGPDQCTERLQELIDLGLDHVYVIGGAATQSPLDVLEGEKRLAREVIPRLRPRAVAAASSRTDIKEES
jgi:5,10-methylenetetrahydromethanopterin reductase